MNPDGDHAPDHAHNAGAELLDFVVSAYRTLQDRWSAAFAEQNCDAAAPWSTLFDRSVLETAPVTAGERLLWNGEDAAVVTAAGVGQHLGLLARAYCRDPLYPDGLPPSSRWPFTAPYACARAVAEGTALVRWLLAPQVNGPSGSIGQR